MTVYPVVGQSIIWTGNGASNEARRLEVLSLPNPGMANQQTVAVPLKLSLLGETTKRGVRRVALRLEGKMGGEWTVIGNQPASRATSAVTGEIPISVHLVMQIPQGVVQLEQGQLGASALLMSMLRELCAIATGASVTSTEAAAMDALSTGVLISALAGSSTLNVISGTYGEASRS